MIEWARYHVMAEIMYDVGPLGFIAFIVSHPN